MVLSCFPLLRGYPKFSIGELLVLLYPYRNIPMPQKTGGKVWVGRRLKLHHMHVFCVIVRCGSMASAAKQLNLSQPTVSEIVADIEHALGVRLLDRRPQG